MKHLFFGLATTIMFLVACSSHDEVINSESTIDSDNLAKVEQLVQNFAQGLNSTAKLQFTGARAETVGPQKNIIMPSMIALAIATPLATFTAYSSN